jgi:uncharacterized protein (TIGR00290 family)
MRKRIIVSWSGGKDSAWTLHVLRRHNEYDVVALLTSVNQQADRIAIHGVRSELLRLQAASAGLPLWTVDLSFPCTNAEYESRMTDVCRRAVAEGVTHFAFGDLFLADIRDYRERQLRDTGLTPVFPLWETPTAALAREMVASGVRAKIACVDTNALDASFAGREFDDALLDALPDSVDPCAERGEFHTFVYDGPMLSRPIAVSTGEIVTRDQFVYIDLLAADEAAPRASAATSVPAPQ